MTLSRRGPHLTLTQAITELAFSERMSSSDLIGRINAQRLQALEEYKESAASADRACVKAGLLRNEEGRYAAFNALLVPLGLPRADVMTAHRLIVARDEGCERRRVEQVLFNNAVWQAGQDIIEAAKRGELFLFGKLKGEGASSHIHTSEFEFLGHAPDYEDALHNTAQGTFWRQVTLEEKSLVEWRAGHINSARPRGRVSQIDWDAIFVLLSAQISDEGGLPDKSAGKGWKSGADAQRFIKGALNDRGEDASPSQIGRMWREFRSQYGHKSK